jgi:hypothetical protein
MSTARFTSRLVVWVPDETAAAYEAMAQNGLMSVSAMLRPLLQDYALQRGYLQPAARNGAAHHHQQPAE